MGLLNIYSKYISLKAILVCLGFGLGQYSYAQTCKVEKPSEFVQAFESKTPCHVSNLFARVLRGKSESDFAKLSDDPQRKIIFLMDSAGLEGLLGTTNVEGILQKIGYTPDYIQTLQQNQTQFKLVVFQQSPQTQLATWENIIALTKAAYGSEVGKIVEKQLSSLKTKSFANIESEAPTAFSVINKKGTNDPEYITEDKLLASHGELWKVRSFLYHRLRLTELFTGNGRTQQSDGSIGAPEYITLNTQVKDLKDVVVISLGVRSK